MKPDQRYPSAGAMFAALAQALAGATAQQATTRGLAIHVELDPTAPLDPMPEVLRYLAERGFMIAVQGSWSVLAVRRYEEDVARHAQSWQVTGGRITTRVGELILANQRVVGGGLLDTATWRATP